MAEPLRYYFDENLDPAIAVQLRLRGIDVLTTADAARAGQRISDADQLAYATQQQRVLVTRDRDFIRVAARSPSHAGILLLQKALSIGEVVEYLELMAHLTPMEEVQGRLVYCAW